MEQCQAMKAWTACALKHLRVLGCFLQAGSSSDSDEEDFLPMKRTAQQRNKRIEEEEEDAEDGPSGGGSHRQSKKAKVSGERPLEPVAAAAIFIDMLLHFMPSVGNALSGIGRRLLQRLSSVSDRIHKYCCHNIFALSQRYQLVACIV